MNTLNKQKRVNKLMVQNAVSISRSYKKVLENGFNRLFQNSTARYRVLGWF